MRWPIFTLLLLSASIEACVVYEYEHEFWLRVDGSGRVNVTGRPDLWAAFKKLGRSNDPAAAVSRETLQGIFKRSGLQVRRVTRTRRAGRDYIFVAADFKDVNQLGGSPAFPDLDLAFQEEGPRLRFRGTWHLPSEADLSHIKSKKGLMAVRFHLPSKVYEHKNAFAGVQRGNIVGWRQGLDAAVAGQPLELGAVMDRRSILSTTIFVFIGAVGAATLILSLILFVVFRRGRRRFAIQKASTAASGQARLFENAEAIPDQRSTPPTSERKNGP